MQRRSLFWYWYYFKITKLLTYKEKYDKLQKEIEGKDIKIRQLERENKRLRFVLQNMRDMASNILDSE